MTDREALRLAFKKLSAMSDRLAFGLVNRAYDSAMAACFDLMDPLHEAMNSLVEHLGWEEIDALIEEIEKECGERQQMRKTAPNAGLDP